MGTATTARGSLGNLPAEVTTFIGRRHEVSEVRRLLSTARLVTLTGPGGIGKTRLAQRVSAEMRRAFPDGVWLAELAELHDPALLAVTIAEALGIRSESDRWGFRSLADHLVDKQMLIVLDNCEQIVQACGDLAETLLRSCPELRILATSRQALGIAGETTLTVRPLSIPDADTTLTPAALSQYESASLFVNRASAIVPDFALDERNCATVAELCRALEGMPLAIELAVVRLRVLSLDQLVDRLADRYRLLTNGTRNAPARQQTLRALIDWSWDLCSEPERALWARLAVFYGGVELDAAEQVGGGEDLPAEAVLDLIASLVDKSILTRVDAGSRVRYRMLESVREYGVEKLAESGELLVMQRRHCTWYAELARRGNAYSSPQSQAVVMRRLRYEQANLRAALEYGINEGEADATLLLAADLENHWLVRGYLTEGRHWIARALELDGSTLQCRGKALRVSAWLALLQGDKHETTALLAEARELADGFAEPLEVAYVRQIEGNVELFAGNLASALTLFEEALAGFRAGGVPSAEMWALAVIGLARGLSGEPQEGFAALEECIEVAAAHQEVWWRSFAQWGLAILSWRSGDLGGATATAKRSLAGQRGVEDERFGAGLALEVLAWIAGTEHRDERAAQLLGAAGRVWRAIRASVVVFRNLQGFHDDCARHVRDRLGAAAFDAAVNRGANLTAAEALELALEQSGPTSAPVATEQAGSPAAALTRREREVAALVAEGLSNREIAARLVVAQRTAEGHVENILSKLGFSSRAQVAAWMSAQQRPSADGPVKPAR